MTKCSFCGCDIERGCGKTKIMKDGKVLHLCGTKCEKNMFKLKRIPRETPWTSEYQALKQVRLGLLKGEKSEKATEKTTKKAKAKK